MKSVLLWGPVLFVMGLIFYFSSLTDPGGPPGGMSDKAAHFLIYAALGGALIRALAGGRSQRMDAPRAGMATMLGTLYGVSDELHQWFVPPRTPEMMDLAADFAGALTGAVGIALLARAVAHLRRGTGTPSI